MITGNDIDRVVGATAYDTEGDRIGSIDTIFLDDTTEEPKFALVNTGMFGLKSSFVPLQDANLDGDDLRVAYSKGQVKDAPNIDPDDGHLEPAQEDELYSFYDLDRDPAGDAQTGRKDTPSKSAGQDTSTSKDNGAMTRSEEELDVGTTQREAGRVRLRKHVVTDHVTKTVPVKREEVQVERTPISDSDADDATGELEMSPDEQEIILHKEEPVTAKRTVPKETVGLDKETHTDQAKVSEEVGREKIEVDDDATRRDR